MSVPDVSIVLAVSEAGSSLEAAMVAAEKGCNGVSAELIIVQAGTAKTAIPQRSGFSSLRVELRPPGTLTPVLWGAGFQLAHGSVVAFTTDQMRVTPAWAQTLRNAITAKTVGAGGPIDLAPDASAATAAAYFLRFAMFSAEAWPASAFARDLPGDNAAYQREAVLRHADLLQEGFWEVEFHRRFEREGLLLRMVPEASATLVGPISFGDMLRRRFRHAKEFGISRVQRHREPRAKLLLLAPLVPFALVFRIGKRALAVKRHRSRFVIALPYLFILAASWAAGEAAGALQVQKSGTD